MSERASKLTYNGNRRKPRRTFPFAPARSLDERDIARLTDAEYAEITGGAKPLYSEPKPRKEPESGKAAGNQEPASDTNEADEPAA